MVKSKKLEVIYYNGQADGIKIIRRHLSTMTTYVIPRPLLAESKHIDEINNPGVYFLINEDNNNNIAQIYIGQARNGIERMDDHNRKKKFWNKAFMFLSDKKTFNLDIINGLEEYCIKKAFESQRYQVENAVNPKFVPDQYDLPIIEEVYEEIKFIMATQGYSLDNMTETKENKTIYHTTRNGFIANGVYSGETFDVLEGSEIDMENSCNLEKYNELRKELLNTNQIQKVDDKYILNKIISFKTPSGAAMFVLGGSTNGWKEWKDQNNKTLDELFRK